MRPAVAFPLALLVWGAGAPGARSVTAQEVTLSEAVRSALDTHPALRAASARLVSAREGVAVASGDRLPQVGLDASLVRFQEPMVVAPLHTFDPTAPPSFDRSLVQGRLGLRQTLFDGGATGAARRTRTALAAGARVEVARTEADLIEHVATAYLAVRTARTVRAAAQARRAALEAEVGRAEQSLSAGTIAQVELVTARAALADAIAEAASATERAALSERTLARITGLEPGRVGASLADVDFAEPLVDPAVEAPPTAPEIAAANESIATANARLDEARSARLPRIDAEGALLDFGSLGGGHTLEWQAGLRVTFPVFLGGSRAARVRAASAEADAARAGLEAARLGVMEEADRARTAAAEADARREALEASVTQWTEVARIEQLALEAGSGVQRDLLAAQAGLFGARAGLARAAADAALARVRLARVLGVLDTAWIESTEGSR